ncbi:hypothetical protein [Tumebacillus permanentifrigoris]|uniref:Loader and inhibitor of G40P protein n=1 Tax=Tumebacillus permanentifrigoris TaxID=378543 RepID=A0A316DQ35_9BACL|nr:hypothetical protein [Tumebacillus permanentifrigoris]PWK05276.1 hypothetical protein C7459_12425 [Tumebacillus permanentifrigoris]
MTKKELARLVERIAQYYEFFEATKEKVEDWHPFFVSIAYETADALLTEYIKSEKRAPAIADLLPKKTTLNTAVLAGDKAIRDFDQWRVEVCPPEVAREKHAKGRALLEARRDAAKRND